MLLDILEWLYPYRTIFAFLLAFCGVVNNYLYFKHVNSGNCRADDYGYFLRLWRDGKRDGIIVIILSVGAFVSGGILLAIFYAR